MTTTPFISNLSDKGGDVNGDSGFVVGPNGTYTYFGDSSGKGPGD